LLIIKPMSNLTALPTSDVDGRHQPRGAETSDYLYKGHSIICAPRVLQRFCADSPSTAAR
jgi:hypothetical protein